jgi:acetolactate synthase-1/2/3 large subunit
VERVAREAIDSIVAGCTDKGDARGSYSEVHAGSDSKDAASEPDYIAVQRVGRVATVLMPADISWTEVSLPDGTPARVQGTNMQDANTQSVGAQHVGAREPDDGTIETVAGLLDSGDKTCFLLGGRALRERPVRMVADIASLTGARIFAEALPARIQRGGSIPAIDRLGYLPEIAIDQLSGIDNLILIDSPAPVSFFAYKGVPSLLAPSGCRVLTLASGFDDIEGALDRLREIVSKSYGGGATGLPDMPGTSEVQDTEHISGHSSLPSGKLDSDSLGKIFAALLPENSIVVDEGVSEGLWAYIHSINSPVHDWLCLSGGAIGQGMPLSIGAAIACPDRKVINLEADGSAMYTIQSLWTQARESLDVVTIILANRSYRLLQIEMDRLSIDRSGPSSNGLTGIASPEIDYAGLARSMGVSAVRVDDAGAFASAFSEALSAHGPRLIEAVLP